MMKHIFISILNKIIQGSTGMTHSELKEKLSNFYGWSGRVVNVVGGTSRGLNISAIYYITDNLYKNNKIYTTGDVCKSNFNANKKGVNLESFLNLNYDEIEHWRNTILDSITKYLTQPGQEPIRDFITPGICDSADNNSQKCHMFYLVADENITPQAEDYFN